MINSLTEALICFKCTNYKVYLLRSNNNDILIYHNLYSRMCEALNNDLFDSFHHTIA